MIDKGWPDEGLEGRVRGQMQGLRRRRSWRRALKRGHRSIPARACAPAFLPRLRNADRKSLLLGTALASTLLFANLCTSTPAHAVVNCRGGNAPINLPNQTADIVCFNANDRSGTDYAINLSTGPGAGGAYSIYLNNSGVLSAYRVLGAAYTISTVTTNAGSPITIVTGLRR
jgi:hypothetical protein